MKNTKQNEYCPRIQGYCKYSYYEESDYRCKLKQCIEQL